MQSWSRVRVAKCQLLVTSSFVLLLGLSMAAMAAVNYLGTHFAVVGRASSDRTPYEATRRWAFCTSISLAGLLTLGAVLGAVATVREAGGLMAGGFLCFALAFCMLVQVAFWRFHNPAQVEGAVLDTYDLVYDQAVRSSSVTLRQQLVAIQDTFLCCGKNSPFGLLGGTEVSLCPGEEATRQGTQARLQRRGPSSWDHFQQPWEPEVPTSQPAEVSPAAQGPANMGADRCTDGRQASLPSPIPAFRATSRMCFLSAAAPNANIFPRPKWRHLSASEMGLLGGGQELPEDLRKHRLHPHWHRPGLHEPVTAGPRSPASSDAPRGGPHSGTRWKRTFSMAACVRADPQGALSSSRTADAASTTCPATCRPTEAERA
ncbi:tetraspanin-32 isoform X3 [Lynx rufus]|uniref:tetraspanin-32 isoform X3 n=1 Tax=Lynx rufus TaxID=61384 RepID=UPI001F123D5A|nr:tetraspanin-32 isoform X3 [Lynx rufus]